MARKLINASGTNWKPALTKHHDNVHWESVLTRIAEGESVRGIAKDYDVPRRTLLHWLHGDDLERQYRIALEARALHHAEKVEDLIHKVEQGEIDPHSARVAIDSRKWLASKFYPKQFGEKQALAVEHDIAKDYVAQLRALNKIKKPKDITPKTELVTR